MHKSSQFMIITSPIATSASHVTFALHVLLGQGFLHFASVAIDDVGVSTLEKVHIRRVGTRKDAHVDLFLMGYC